MKKNWKLIVASVLLIGQIGQLINGNCSPFVILIIIGLIIWHFCSQSYTKN